MAEPESTGKQRHPGIENLRPFPPGVSGNPSGRPKGSWSARSALKRKLRKEWEKDTESDDGEQIGKAALALADALWEATMAGDAERVLAITRTIAEAEGKPQERVEHTGQTDSVVILRLAPDDDNPEELPPGVE